MMEFQKSAGRIFALGEDGKVLAEVTFPKVKEGLVDIDHTFVDPSLRGQGVAGKLLRAAAQEIRSQGQKAKLTCSYAVTWFENHPEEQDLVCKE